MNFIAFRNRFFELGCFSSNQVYAWNENFDKNNLTRWCRRDLILRLRQGFYCFPEYLRQPNFAFFVSNYIYKPSYVSLHSALAFYGVIPEAVTQITAVSSLKTADFQNAFGAFSYMKMKPELIFGYEQKPFGERSLLIATPEKAILDLLYLYPFYNTPHEIANLRFDGDFMQNELNVERLMEFADRFGNKELQKRVGILMRTYNDK
jgi:predicted transcriptional regulator of viral defense system